MAKAKKKLNDDVLNDVSGGIGELAQKTNAIEQKTNLMEQKTDMLAQKTDQLDQKINALAQKTNQLDKLIASKEKDNSGILSRLLGKKNNVM